MLQLGYVSRRFLYEKDKEVLMEEKCLQQENESIWKY